MSDSRVCVHVSYISPPFLSFFLSLSQKVKDILEQKHKKDSRYLLIIHHSSLEISHHTLLLCVSPAKPEKPERRGEC